MECLRHWIRGRLSLTDAVGGSYFYKPLACELCKSLYPTYVHAANKRQTLVEVPVAQPPFIVLENISQPSQQRNGAAASHGLHVMSLAEKVIKIGRASECDVHVNDVSMSRCHAIIRFQRGHFYLEDNNSKFGTLVQMKKPTLLEPGSTLSIQSGRTVLSVSEQPDTH